MSEPQSYRESPATPNRRTPKPNGRGTGAVPIRGDDIEASTGIHWVAKLVRVMSGLFVLLAVIQAFLGLTSAVEISYGVLTAEVIRLVIFAGLLWGAGDLADLFVKSSADLRASRILLGRVAHLLEDRDRGDDTH